MKSLQIFRDALGAEGGWEEGLAEGGDASFEPRWARCWEEEANKQAGCGNVFWFSIIINVWMWEYTITTQLLRTVLISVVWWLGVQRGGKLGGAGTAAR